MSEEGRSYRATPPSLSLDSLDTSSFAISYYRDPAHPHYVAFLPHVLDHRQVHALRCVVILGELDHVSVYLITDSYDTSNFHKS